MSTKPVARRHHYLPQAYLAAFTDDGTQDSQFFVLDVESGRRFSTSPKNVAVERDFNRVDIEGVSPDAIEQALSSLEERAAQAIRQVIAREEFPDGDGHNLILNLLGLIAVRNPKFRGSFNQSRAHSMRVIADLLVSDKKIWEHHVRKAREAGEIGETDVSFEDMKRFVEEGNYNIEFHPQGNLRVEFNAFDKLLPILGQRTWSVLVAPADGPEFVSSDHPVTLVWKNGQHGPVGYGLAGTAVFFPLGRRVGFYGVFENPMPPVVKLQPEVVARMNRRVAWNADRHVFSTLPSFVIWYEGKMREVNVVTTE